MSRDDLVVRDGVLTEYRGPGGDVTVPAGVTAIGDGAFRDRRDLRSLTLPEGLVRIGNEAFHLCSDLLTAELPESLTEIGDRAFSGCLLLRGLSLPQGLRRIGDQAFLGCLSLGRTDLPPALRSIGEGAFYECRRLTAERFPERLDRVGRFAFSGCGSLRRFELPPALEEVPPGLFAGCGSLEEAVLPRDCREIGGRAFEQCVRLRRLSGPARVRRVGEDAFAGCRALADGEGFIVVGGTLCGVLDPREGPLTLPAAATGVAAGVFGGRRGLLSLCLHGGVTHAEEDAFLNADLLLRIPRWAPGLGDALARCARLIIAAEDSSRVPPRFRGAARIGDALQGKASREDEAWLARNSVSLCADAFRFPALLRFLCERRLIRPGDADAWLEAAGKEASPALTALLLDYQDRLGFDAVEEARARRRLREEAAAELRAGLLASPEAGLKGLRVAAVGPLPPRLRDRLEALGARTEPFVSGKTALIVTDDPEAETETLQRAAALGLPILSPKELEALLPE